jgi:hypothetical protein
MIVCSDCCAGQVGSRIVNFNFRKVDDCTLTVAFSSSRRMHTARAQPGVPVLVIERTTRPHTWCNTLSWPSRPINALKATDFASPNLSPPDAWRIFDTTSIGIVSMARDPSIGATVPPRTDLYYIALQNVVVASPSRPHILAILGFVGSPFLVIETITQT